MIASSVGKMVRVAVDDEEEGEDDEVIREVRVPIWAASATMVRRATRGRFARRDEESETIE